MDTGWFQNGKQLFLLGIVFFFHYLTVINIPVLVISIAISAIILTVSSLLVPVILCPLVDAVQAVQ